MSLMPTKVREVIRLLEKHGWVEMRSRGSHRISGAPASRW
jgi:predicted RNA binding protein YcfA (HicA-like mRNA interferase family)